MHPKLCRLLVQRGRWKPFVICIVCYLLAVTLVENVLIAWKSGLAGSGVQRIDIDGAQDQTVRQTVSGLPRVATTAGKVSETRPFRGAMSTTNAAGDQPKSSLSLPPIPTHHFSISDVRILTSQRHQQRQQPQQVEASLEDRQRAFYQRRPYKVNPYRHQVVFAPAEFCTNNTRMVILVHTYHTHGDRRSAIRQTWATAARSGKWPNDNSTSCAGIRLAFVLGMNLDPGLNDLIREERDMFDDIVQGDFKDSYQNMTLKSLLGLKIVDELCPRIRYLLKTDDDMIVNLPYLLDLLEAKSLSRSIMGPLNLGSRVYRHGKWKLTKDEFPFEFYPPYESGSAYVITADLVHDLYETSEYVPPIFIDDVYVTGILGRILDVNHVRQKGFAFWTDRAPNVCDILRRRVIAGTKMSPVNLLNLWSVLQQNPRCEDLPSTTTPPTTT